MRVIDSNKVSNGLLVLMGTQVVSVLLLLAYMPLLGLDERMEWVFSGVWMLFTLVMCVGLALVALGTEPPVLAWVLLVLELGTSVVNEVANYGPRLLGLPDRAMELVGVSMVGVSQVERALLLWLLVRLLGGRHLWAPMVAVGVFFVALARATVPFAVASSGAMEVFASPLYGLAQTGASLLSAGGSLTLTWFARKAVLAGDAVDVPAREAALGVPAAEQPYSPRADFAIGGALLLIGVGVTAASMSAASGGGRYLVATGAIGAGLARIIRALVKSSRDS